MGKVHVVGVSRRIDMGVRIHHRLSSHGDIRCCRSLVFQVTLCRFYIQLRFDNDFNDSRFFFFLSEVKKPVHLRCVHP